MRRGSLGAAGAAGADVGIEEEVVVLCLWLSRASRGAAKAKEDARATAMMEDVNRMVTIGDSW